MRRMPADFARRALAAGRSRLAQARAGTTAFDGYRAGSAGTAEIDRLPDDELHRLNDLLPWAAFVVDANGRRFGDAYSTTKRSEPQDIPDRRIVELDRRVPLGGLTVLEVGCFEGIHTVALCRRAEQVIALDSRIENVVKTIVRCSLLGEHPHVHRIDLEAELPTDPSLECDVLHHVGVLYHLTDPVAHLTVMGGLTRRAIMLDTHVAPVDGADLEYTSAGRAWPYYRLDEPGRTAPFAGMLDHAKWLRLDDLVELLRSLGFDDVDVAEQRDERNGPRVLIYAKRTSA